jgi:serine/threonine protein kinase
MGEVYRARDSKLNRDVAIKVLPDGFAQDAERVARFQREAQVLASLNHPNIAAIYGLEESGSVLALVMELVEGPTLADRIAAGPIPVDESLSIAKQIAEALEVAHERGIVHRDLKPANVKVTPDDTVKVLDFGLAKVLANETPDSDLSHSPTLLKGTQAGMILGTAAYMSPEQAKGKAVDKRSDIWAFGCVLFEMLTGKQTFGGETLTDTLASVVRAEPEWDMLPATTPGAVHKLLRRCLTKDLRLRLRDIGEARIAIEQIKAGEEPSAVSAPRASRLQRNLWTWIGTTAVMATALAVFVTLRWQPARTELPLRQFKLDIHNFKQTMSSRPKLSPDGRNLAYVADEKLWVQSLDEIKPHEIDTGIGHNITTLIWSHDSRSLAFSSSGLLYRVLASGGKTTQICKLPDTILEGAWSSDDQIVFARWRGDLYQVSAQGGEPKPLGIFNPETEVDFHSVIFLPGNNVLMFGVHPKKEGPFRTELLVGRERRIIVDRGWVEAYAETGHLLIRLQGALWAVPFSVSELKVTGEAFKVLDGHPCGIGTDGTLVYTRGGEASQNQIVWVSRSGEIQQKIGEPLASVGSVALSPDGSRLAVEANTGDSSDIFVHDLVRNVRTLMAGGEQDEGYPAWSPDGKHVYYNIRLGMGATLYVKSADGTGEARELGPGVHPSVSQNGEVLTYGVPGQDARMELWYQRMNAGEATPVPNSPPSRYLSLREAGTRIWLSPDGQFAAYRSTLSGNAEIYLSRFPSGEGRWQVSVDGGVEMVWSPRGNELFYVDAHRTLFSVPVATQPAVQLGKPQRLFSLREKTLQEFDFAVAPDGQRFVMVQGLGDEAGSRALYLLQGWATLLKQAHTK